MRSENRLWYKKSADDVNSALPCGNGRMGAMVYGRAINELISLNEDSVWSGGHRNRNNPDAYEGLQQVRKFLDEGRVREAEKCAFRTMSGVCTESRSYMPLGNLFIHMTEGGKAREYSRELDLEKAINTTQYTIDGVRFIRQVFVSFPDNVLVVHFTASEPGKISFTANIDGREGFYDDNRPCDKNVITYTGGSGGHKGINFACYMTATAEGGRVSTSGAKLVVEEADEATLFFTSCTSFYSDIYEDSARMDLDMAAECSYAELMYRHVEDYSSLFSRTRLELEDTNFDLGEDGTEPTTAERLVRLRGNGFDDTECIRNIFDPGLVTLLFNYGRYLMIQASRPGSQPMNQQGIWNEDMHPQWGSRYTINVSTEMNYWASEVCNLSECHLPLFDLLKRIAENGKETASKMYHAGGFVCHHNTDIWGDTAPHDMYQGATIWVTGAAWLCLHIFEHYRFTGDKDFLEENFDLLKGASQFFFDFLIENEDGFLVTSPTVSPENSYKTESGEKGSLSKGSSMDSQIIRALFRDTIDACGILCKDKELAESLKKASEKLLPVKVGKYGQIQEWAQDFDEAEVGHRHVSQLFGLYPENLISVIKTPKLADAARATLIRRLVYEDGHYGWSYAWNMNMWARLRDGQMAYENLQKLFLYSLTPNMLNNYPPFQIDGNLGVTAGIAECLLQSQDDELLFLPALPSNWTMGRVKGLCARNGFEVDIEWEDSRVKEVCITSKLGRQCRIRTDLPYSVSSLDSKVDTFVENGLICFDTAEGGKYYIRTDSVRESHE